MDRVRETKYAMNEKFSKATVILKKKQIETLEISSIRPKTLLKASVTDCGEQTEEG